MSLCRSRLFSASDLLRNFEEIPALNLNEEEIDSPVDSSFHDASMESISPSPRGLQGITDRGSPICCNPDFASPTPAPSPMQSNRVTRSRRRSPKTSPIPLNFDADDEDTDRVPPLHGPSSKKSPGNTPPHKKLKALRLFDTPHTPKSLLQKAQRRTVRSNRTKLFNVFGDKKHRAVPERPLANVNPFTPNNNTVQSRGKRPRPFHERSILDDSMDEDTEEDTPCNKKIALHEINTSRYNEEFYEVCILGDGEFGSVHKCVNRLDGCVYAIKKSKTPVAGSANERSAMNEVFAHAVLGKHPHLVRYYSAWAENDHMFIQNEYCNGGSLAEALKYHEKTDRHFTETELKQILHHVVLGLKYIHSQNLVHLDIKPGNIFIHRDPKILNSPESGLEADISDDYESDSEPVTYKIGDLGHVTSVANPRVEEGDCRYLPREILLEDQDHLNKADIFSLALTIFEMGGGGPLPKNGDEWHSIRNGNLPTLTRYSEELNNLLKSMIHPDPSMRPSAATVANHPILCPFASKSRSQLRKELNEERFKNELLSRQLLQARNTTATTKNTERSSRLVGRKTNRSMSLTCF